MTIRERIELHKLGYTKDEIRELIEAETNVENIVENVDNPTDPPEEDKPAWAVALLDKLDKLEKDRNRDNIRESEQPPQKTPEEILSGFFVGNN